MTDGPATDADTAQNAASTPAFSVVGGRPTPEDLAALTLVVAGLGDTVDERPAPRSRWAAPRRSLNGGTDVGWGR